MKKLSPALVIIVLCLLHAVLGSAQDAVENSVRVTVKLNTWYDDSASSLRQVKSFVEFFPPKSERTLPGEDVNHFIIRRYRFGPTQLPKTYILLRNAIFAANNLKRDDEPIKSGSIQAPRLPRRARPFPNPNNPYNAFPQVVSFTAMNIAFATTAVVERTRIDRAFREGSRTAIVNFDLPRDYVQARANTDQFKSANFRTSAPVKLHMRPAACGTLANAVPFPDATIRNAVNSLFSRPRKRFSYLFVLDSGWPSQDTYNDTLALFEPVLATLRAGSGLAPYSRANQPSFHPIDPRRTSTHVLSVAAALDDLRRLDTQPPRVRVIFVPLGLDQGDDDFFRNLLQTYYAYAWTHSLEGQTPVARELEQAVLEKTAADYADTVIQKLHLLSPPGEFYTDNGILEAVYMVAEVIAKGQNTSYFANESWTVDSGLLKFSPTLLARGISVVASGNDDQDFIQQQVDFARQCLTSDYYIAVMNVTPDGLPQCHTSLVDENRIADLRVVGFNGNIANDSGTSFASPRVAWLLAARETTTVMRPSYWVTDTIRAVKAARQPRQPKWRNVLFDVQDYFAH